MRTLRTSTILYPLANGAHILSFGTLVGAIVVWDIAVLRGRDDAALARATLAVTRWGFVCALLTGCALLATRAGHYLANPAMQAKGALLTLALLNVIAFHRANKRHTRRTLAGASLAVWVAIVLAGRWIGFV